jgi:hypothetical protein
LTYATDAPRRAASCIAQKNPATASSRNKKNGRMLMATTIERLRASQDSGEPTTTLRGSNELVKLIRKLRWIGLDDEAEPLQAELTRRAATDSVVAMSGETD